MPRVNNSSNPICKVEKSFLRNEGGYNNIGMAQNLQKEEKRGHQLRHTKLHDTIPISLSDVFAYESIEQRYRDGVSYSFVCVCCVMTPFLFLFVF